MKWIFILLSFLFAFGSILSLDTKVQIEISKDTTKYDYIFTNDTIKSEIALEVPINQKSLIVKNQYDTNLNYEIDGKFLVIFPSLTTKEILVSFSTDNGFLNEEADYFSNFFNVKTNVNNLEYILIYDKILEIENTIKTFEIFPRNLNIDENKIIWQLENVNFETLFFVDYKANSLEVYNKTQDLILSRTIKYFILFLFFPIVIFFGIVFYILFKKDKVRPVKKSNLNKKDEHLNYSEMKEKYLTENEKEVVEVIKKNIGISQLDILNFLPYLTKSNLSKIITKLDSKKFLHRVKVGKVTKIYLGEALSEKVIKEK